jgi:uncharacterized protein
MSESTPAVYTSPHILEYPYQHSTGPVLSSFLTALRDGVIIGIRGTGGRVICPPTEYDPETSEETSGIVEVGPGGVVDSIAFVPEPLERHALATPFAWALITLDGADTALLHMVDVTGGPAVSVGDRVVADFRSADERVGSVLDIRAFVKAEVGS